MPRARYIEELGIPGAEIRRLRQAKERYHAEAKNLRALARNAADAIERIADAWTEGNLGGAVSSALSLVPELRAASDKPARRK